MVRSKGFIYSLQGELFGKEQVVGFGTEDYYVKEIGRDKANDVIVKNHYSHKFYNASYIHLGVFMAGELVGVLQYGYAMNPSSCGSVVTDTQMDEYLELNRMWIDDKAPRNSESKAISYSMKYIRGKYPKIKWVQSFADERCGGFGIVYQACSFIYYGEHTSIFWELDGETYHNSIMTRANANLAGYKLLTDPKNVDRVKKYTLRQFRYIKFIDRRYIKKCKLTQKPYPKHYNGD